MPDPMHFDDHAEVYHRARPPYPQALWQRLAELGLLRRGTRVVELGAGSGQATAPMLAAGAAVTAVEPGPSLARLLRWTCPDADVLESPAETAPLPTAAFDLAVAATAVHWFDLDRVLPLLHRSLVPGGHLAVWRNAFGDPTLAPTPFRRRVAGITGRRRGAPRPGPDELDTAGWADRLGAHDLFVTTHTEELRWSTGLTEAQVRDLFSTFSNWTGAEVDEVAEAVRELGGRVLEHYVTPLLVLRRADGA